MQRSLGRAYLMPVIVLLIAPTSLWAQENVSVGPLLGFYLATSAFIGPDNGPTGSTPYKQRDAPVLGVQATFWTAPRFAIGTTVAWSSSDVSRPGGAADSSGPSSILLLAAYMVLRVNSLERDNAVHVRLGLAGVGHNGQAFETWDHPMSFAVTTGVEATLPLRSNIRGVGGFDLYVYTFPPDMPGAHYEQRTMVDAVARVGVNWGFGERQGP